LKIQFRREDLSSFLKRLSLLSLLIILAFLPLPLARSSYLISIELIFVVVILVGLKFLRNGIIGVIASLRRR